MPSRYFNKSAIDELNTNLFADNVKVFENDTEAEEAGYIPIFVAVCVRSTDNTLIVHDNPSTVEPNIICNVYRATEKSADTKDMLPLGDFVLLSSKSYLMKVLDPSIEESEQLAFKTFPQYKGLVYTKKTATSKEGVYFLSYVIVDKEYMHSDEFILDTGYKEIPITDLDSYELGTLDLIIKDNFVHIQKGGEANV